MRDYAIGVKGIQDALETKLGIRPTHVVMVSDEQDPAWWHAVNLMGWYTPNHAAEKTGEKYGAWYVYHLHLFG